MSNAFGTVSCSSVTVATISGGGGGDERCGKPVVSVDEPVALADAEDVVAAAIGTGSVTGVTLGGGVVTGIAAEAAVAAAVDSGAAEIANAADAAVAAAVDAGEAAGVGAAVATSGCGAALEAGRLAAFAAST